jgi:hypothetical protein
MEIKLISTNVADGPTSIDIIRMLEGHLKEQREKRKAL